MELRGYTTGDFDRGAPRWWEALWMAVKCLFFLGPWPWPSRLRVALLRFFGAKIGPRVVIRSQVNISFPWRLEVGRDVWIGEGVMILSLERVTIGPSVCISQRAFICTGTHDFRAPHFDLIVRPVTIGGHSWIAAQCFIAPGVEIGEGSVIGAGSIVSESVPEGSLVRGNPAEIVGIVVVREEEEEVERETVLAEAD
jgi:putative colanic acid biosynthesis acetyltransferase WcaF